VSIAADSKGIPRVISFVSRVEVLTDEGITDELDGSKRTSSNVRASRICIQASSHISDAEIYIFLKIIQPTFLKIDYF
tara:strand:+ start:1679 stop:1912 length:234 start_codon:yes stop_codon:yes gene_type:complete